ncbi:MAG: VCBS repeat-containing protein [Deltaproteobacteria bacterium]|nr:VCBS repeat-containing protein [Deltaproteobacteria bacterium]
MRYGADHTTVAVGDLNGDGRPDLAVVYHTASRVGVFLGQVAGTFAAASELTTGARPWKVAMGDFNGDARPDLVTANGEAGSVSVFLGIGDGTFGAKADFPAGADAGWVEVADFNGDGALDLVVGGSPYGFGSYLLTGYRGPSTAGVLLGNGDGTFRAVASVLTGTSPTVVAVGDLDGDGKLDLVVATSGAGGLSVLMGRGDGTFASKGVLASGPSPVTVALGDLNGDGRLDAVTTDLVSSTLSAFMGKGDGTFSPRVDYQTPSAPVGLTIGDLDGDGHADVAFTTLATTTRGPWEISVFFGKGDGTFRGAVRSSLGVNDPCFVTLADLDADGRPEITAANMGFLDYLDYPARYFPVGFYRVTGGAPLTVTPPTAGGVSPGGRPIRFAASSGGTPRTVSWSLSPAVGTLSANSGTSVEYTPPAEPASPPQAVELVADAGSEQVRVAIFLSTQVERPLGSTSAPSGFLEYLPPGYDDGLPRPLLVFLQGSAGNGDGVTTLSSNLTTWGVPAMLAHGGWPAEYPFVVLSPQHVGPSWAPAAELEVFLDWAMASYRVDPKQVYLTGLSWGAFTAWDYLKSFRDSRVAAAVLIAGDPRIGATYDVCPVGAVAIWTLHGTSDDAVPVQGERDAMNRLIACPAPPRREAILTLIPGGSHYVFDDIYLGRLGYDVFGWLLAHPKP